MEQRVHPMCRLLAGLILLAALVACERAHVAAPAPQEPAAAPAPPEPVASPAPEPQAVDEDPPLLAGLRKDMPADVSDFIRRAVTCNHWAGEEPYNEERRAQMAEAVGSLRCRELDTDQRALAKLYHGNAEVLRRIRQSRSTPF
jgi:hypothetical protein